MLLNLKIKDLILVDDAEIEFGEGLHIFTGETGSGKSAILTALRLIGGERASADWIRAGASLAIVEAKISKNSPLTIRREIHRSGKSRCFLEDRLVSGTDLREYLSSFLEIVDQGAAHEFTSSNRDILDTYLGLTEEAKLLTLKYDEMKRVEKELSSSSDVNRDLAWATQRSLEIEEVNWKKEEESDLNQMHHLLTHAQTLTEKAGSAAHELSLLSPRIRHLASLLEGAAALDPSLKPSAQTILTTALELKEIDHFLCSYTSRIEADPLQLERVEKRIAAIHSIKKRFGETWEEVEKQKLALVHEIERLQMFDETQAALKEKGKSLGLETAQIAQTLSDRRKLGALGFSEALLKELSSLNLPDAKFVVEITEKPLSDVGIDEIRFLFTASPHLPPMPLEQCASGGELSRLLFATKVVLAEKEKTECLILDEIDSNVGGQTAAILGEKLKMLSKKRQVICVTHFVQVAKCANHHFAVFKKEVLGKTTTFVEKLDARTAEREYARMIGH